MDAHQGISSGAVWVRRGRCCRRVRRSQALQRRGKPLAIIGGPTSGTRAGGSRRQTLFGSRRPQPRRTITDRVHESPNPAGVPPTT